MLASSAAVVNTDGHAEILGVSPETASRHRCQPSGLLRESFGLGGDATVRSCQLPPFSPGASGSGQFTATQTCRDNASGDLFQAALLHQVQKFERRSGRSLLTGLSFLHGGQTGVEQCRKDRLAHREDSRICLICKGRQQLDRRQVQALEFTQGHLIHHASLVQARGDLVDGFKNR